MNIRRRALCKAVTLMTLGATLATVPGCAPKGLLIIPVSPNQTVREETLENAGFLAPKIAVIDIDGLIVNTSSPTLLGGGEHPVSFLVEKLDRAASDKRVKAVVLRINSPGGGVTASELMHTEIKRFRERTGKPIVTVMMDVAASGGYYIACATDEIIAHRSTVTGSIGVIIQLFDVTGTMAKIGITPTILRSGDLKGGGSPFKKLSDADRAVFQGLIDHMYGEFVKVVVDGRPGLTESRVRELADGRVYTAPQALDNGLIDGIGTVRDAVTAAKHRAGIAKASVVIYHRPFVHTPNIYAKSPVGGDINIINVQLPSWLKGHSARCMYLWAP